MTQDLMTQDAEADLHAHKLLGSGYVVEEPPATESNPLGILRVEPAKEEPPSKPSDDGPAKVSAASPRFWHGMRFGEYIKLLVRGRFQIHFSAIGMAVAILIFSVFNSILAMIQWLVLGRKIAKTEIEKPPLFIVGHWRSGTTLAHELISQDPKLRAPSTYQCFAPSHFLITEWLFKPILGWVMPKQRPMDNMETGPDHPNEDEFAICALGGPSPYTSMAFPNEPKPYQETIDMVGVSDEEKKSLADTMLFFSKCLTHKVDGAQLVLKSPTHTGRIEFLRQLFPGAKFLHVCRDPQNVIPSTVRLWTRLDQVNCFQLPTYSREELAESVGATFNRMYTAFDKATAQQNDDLYTLRYEDLVKDPVKSLKQAYGELGLTGFEDLEPKLIEYMEAKSDYKRNKHHLSDSLRQLINDNCGFFQEKYGYPPA